MKRIFISLIFCICVLAMNAQGKMICNFDDVQPARFDGNEDLVYAIGQAPEGSLASGNMLTVKIPANNEGGTWFAIELNDTFDPRDYVGFSFSVQVPEGVNPSFALKLEQTASEGIDGNYYADTRIQDWNSYFRYQGADATVWHEVRISFDALVNCLRNVSGDNCLGGRLEQNPDFPADKYDRIVLVPAGYDYKPAFTLNIDNIQLYTSWPTDPDEPGEPEPSANIMVCNFDDVFPYVEVNGMVDSYYDDAPADSPASGQVGVFEVPANNLSGGTNAFVTIPLDFTFDPREYVGISFLAQIPEDVNPCFGIKLEQSASEGQQGNWYGNTRIQKLGNYNDRYNGNGEWVEVHVQFAGLLTGTATNDCLEYRLAQNPDFPADQYDRIVIVPAAYDNKPAFTLYIDDIKLRTTWEDEPEPQPAKSVLICNYDDVLNTPFYNTNLAGFSANYDNDAPANSPASGKVLTITVPATSDASKYFGVQVPFKFDPRDYVGISFLAQIPEGAYSLRFGLRLQQSTDPANSNQLQTLTYYEEYDPGRYTGNGEWQEVHVIFDHMTLKEYSIPYRQPNVPNSPLRQTGNVTNIWDKLADNSNYPANQFDKISIAISPNIAVPNAHTLLIDNVKLRGSWDDEVGIPLVINNSDAINIIVENGTIRAIAADGNPVSLKVYSLSGQEIAGRMNQVQVGMKGIYIVKATTGNTSKVSKVIVR